jgi:uncharacterized membrane protein
MGTTVGACVAKTATFLGVSSGTATVLLGLGAAAIVVGTLYGGYQIYKYYRDKNEVRCGVIQNPEETPNIHNIEYQVPKWEKLECSEE